MQSGTTDDWIPDRSTALYLNLGAVVLTFVALIGYTALYMVGRPSGGTIVFDGKNIVFLLLMVLGMFLFFGVHELLHGFALRTLGHTPKYGATMVGGVLPAFYCTAPGVAMSKTAFYYVASLPGIVLAVIPAIWIMAQLPGSGWLVVPAAFLLGGTVGDIALIAKVIAAPKGTYVEDLKDGIRLHLPAGGQ